MLQMNGYLDVASDDPDVQRRARLLNILLLGVTFVTIIALILILVADIFNFVEGSLGIFYFGVSLVLIGNVFFYFINRRGYVDLASTIFLALLTTSVIIS